MQIRRVSVVSVLPERLQPLREIAGNFWWTWYPEAHMLFQSMDAPLWEQVYHNAVQFLRRVSQKRLEELAQDQAFCANMDDVYKEFQRYMKERKEHPAEPFSHEHPIAYFSAEFGLHESLQVYSGGLGILAGDHCKAASDLKIPLIGIGLLYKSGYFVQSLNVEGMQQADYPTLDFDTLALERVLNDAGMPLSIEVNISGKQVRAQIWRADVGHVTLYLLDADMAENDEWGRNITAKLYGGGTDTRIAQEMLLGIGGRRAIAAMGITPKVYHINEGHAAFLSLERIREMRQDEGLTFDESIQAVASSQVFTTHTPVPAGHDQFDVQLFGRFLGPYIETLGVDFEHVWNLGTRKPNDYQQNFYMTVLALRTSRLANGVSALHGKVSREMWRDLYAGIPVDEIPIRHITNGVHTSTWLSTAFDKLYRKYLGEDWWERGLEDEVWDKVNEIPDEELWAAHMEMKQTLVDFVRARTVRQRERLNEPPTQVAAARKVLDPEALTIGFARRFAPYKRATLIFRDLDRLNRIINHPERPVQLIFAGKSHPHNQEGKDILQRVYQVSRMPQFEGKILFVEDYDTNVGRHLVQGVDVWLNNPVRPQEASGTSGQKVPLNGG
ncbi:MAG: alpha-glucan family phosphorylase, partial [Myxococcota bacterium]